MTDALSLQRTVLTMFLLSRLCERSVCLVDGRRICIDTFPPPRCLAGYYIQVFLIMFFLLSSDLLITLRYVVLPISLAPRPVDTISSQGVCDNFQKQDTRTVLCGSDVGENVHVTRNICSPASDHHNPPSNPNRRRRPVPGEYRPPAHVGSKLDWHCVWYVVALFLIVDTKS